MASGSRSGFESSEMTTSLAVRVRQCLASEDILRSSFARVQVQMGTGRFRPPEEERWSGCAIATH